MKGDRKHVAALILARGGSKGIRLKNISKIGDRTLLTIAIETLKNIEDLSSIWVSTDNFVIAEEANKGETLCKQLFLFE